jgi:regulator of sirC expression with transglutaminase-like and TPR domain
VFHADGGDKHYGFYPSGGQLRLTRFDGPDVYSWKILKQEPSAHYRPGDWNTLKVRIEKDRIRCYVNDHLAFETSDTGLTSGKVGLAKFRDTQAEFKQFQVAGQIASTVPPPEMMKRLGDLAKSLEGLALREAPKPGVIEALAPDAPASVAALRERAKQLEQQAAQLRQLAVAVHQKRVLADLVKAIQGKDEDIDLVHAALLIARLDNDELDVEAYRKEFERMAREIAAGLGKEGDEKAKLATLNKYLFAENGFHGSRGDYYNRSNSYLNEVLDDREGLPITLSVLYMELARRLGLKVVGVGLPGHFVVRHVPAKGDAQLIDVYEGGQPISREDADKKVQALADRPLEEKDLTAVSKRAILVRMLHNLMGLARGNRDAEAMLRYVDAILTLTPDAAEEHWMRALLRYQTGRRHEAMEDADWLLEHKPPGMQLERVMEFRRMLERPEK